MPRHNLNFSRWLDRLGLKTGVAPDLLPIIQPTMQLADTADLVEKKFAQSGVIGGFRVGLAGNFGMFKIESPVAVRLRIVTGPCVIRTGLGSGQAFAGGVTPLLPQPFDPNQTEFQFTARIGHTTVTPGDGVPSLHTPGFGAVIPELWCPEGGFLEVRNFAIAFDTSVLCTFYETPPQSAP